jgi:hypothetical protein
MAGSIDDRLVLGARDSETAPGVAIPFAGRVHEWVVTVDHKKLGLMYIGGGLVFFLVAGLQAATIRLQLAVPNAGIVSPQVFNRLLTLHGTAMVFLVGMPILTGFFNYLVPLMIGARDLAFPRLNAFGFWLWFFGSLLLYFSYIGGGGMEGEVRIDALMGTTVCHECLESVPITSADALWYSELVTILTSSGVTPTAIDCFSFN